MNITRHGEFVDFVRDGVLGKEVIRVFPRTEKIAAWIEDEDVARTGMGSREVMFLTLTEILTFIEAGKREMYGP